MPTDYEYIIGIDPGTDTGFAIRQNGKDELYSCDTTKLHKALTSILAFLEEDIKIFVFLEDAHLSYKPKDKITKNDLSKSQGVGSIKRDCSIWKDFLNDKNIPFKTVKPTKKNTKLPLDLWKKITKWEGRTSHNARDAGILAMMNPSASHS